MVATDHAAIAAALAAKAAAIAGVRGATHKVPDALPYTPFVVVFPPTRGSLTELLSQDLMTLTFPVFLYLAKPADTGRTLATVYTYVDAFYAAWRTGRTLAVANVQESYLTGHEIDDLPDYEGHYLGIRFHVDVRVRENVSRSS